MRLKNILVPVWIICIVSFFGCDKKDDIRSCKEKTYKSFILSSIAASSVADIYEYYDSRNNYEDFKRDVAATVNSYDKHMYLETAKVLIKDAEKTMPKDNENLKDMIRIAKEINALASIREVMDIDYGKHLRMLILNFTIAKCKSDKEYEGTSVNEKKATDEAMKLVETAYNAIHINVNM